jgi:hypothetical protein
MRAILRTRFGGPEVPEGRDGPNSGWAVCGREDFSFWQSRPSRTKAWMALRTVGLVHRSSRAMADGALPVGRQPVPVGDRPGHAAGRDADHVPVGVDADPGGGAEDGHRGAGPRGRPVGLGSGGGRRSVASGHGAGYRVGEGTESRRGREGTGKDAVSPAGSRGGASPLAGSPPAARTSSTG